MGVDKQGGAKRWRLGGGEAMAGDRGGQKGRRVERKRRGQSAADKKGTGDERVSVSETVAVAVTGTSEKGEKSEKLAGGRAGVTRPRSQALAGVCR